MQLNDVPSDCAYKGVVYQLHRVRNSCSTPVRLQRYSITANSAHHRHVKS